MNHSSNAAADPRAADHRSFIVVGIGASAGGLEAVEAFLTHLPAQTGMAFVLVQHLDPAHPSLMPELLARHSKMPVQAAAGGMPVAPDRLYVMPPNVTLTIHQGVLQTTTPAPQAAVRTHIDTFLRSLAEDRAERAVGVILSGAGSDGTLGLKAIKEYGGITVVQSPASAKYDSMPLSAISTGLVDYTLAVEDIPAKLMEHAAYLEDLQQRKSAAALQEETARHLPRICEILHHATGHDFSGYKPSTMVRRIARRMQVWHLDSVVPYVAQLEQDPKEAEQLFKDLLIGLTQFFRDAEAFEALASQALARLLEDKGADARVRVWVPGCASGEEAYSIAMILSEQMARRNVAPTVQIFATDIDDEAIATARLGKYPASLVEPMAAARRERFFTRQGERYQVNKQIRDLCVFSLHNLVRDPPFSALDLISCRNLLIYLDAGLQKKLVPLFHYALAPRGYLFLGSSEGLADFSGLFRAVDKKNRLYQRLEAAQCPPVAFPLTDPLGSRRLPASPAHRPERLTAPDIGAMVERVALGYAPPCVVINERAEILYSFGETSPYLQQPTGAPSLNLIDQARKGLRLRLRAAIREALKTRAPVVQPNLTVQTPAGLQAIDLTVRPLAELGAAVPLWVVVLQPAVRARRPAPAARSDTAASAVQQLETELKTTRDELQTAAEEQEGANEELKSSNEELLSMNEELQSANEELQTSKEEMQSVNEELGTVNSELNHKIEQADMANADLQNLLRSTEIATLFLDRDLRLKRFTPAAAALFHLLESDAGRPISIFAPRLADMDLVAEMRAVLQTEATREHAAFLPETRSWFMVRIVPSRTLGQALDGVVVTLVNVTALKEAAEALAVAKSAAEAASKAKDDFIAVLSHELRTPLTPVLATVQMMEADNGPPVKDPAALALLRRNIEVELCLIDDLLDVTRISQGKLALHLRPLDLHDIQERVLGMCAREVEAKQLKLAVELQARHHWVHGDPARLQQVLWNLVKNAVKFTPAGGTITVRTENPTPDHVTLAVRDTGVGIAPDLLCRIFNAFEQGAYARQFGGVGLGLAISKHIAEMHGGTLRAQSPGKDQGATFMLELGTCAAPSAGAAAPVVAATPAAPGKGCQILLVEDHPDTSRALGLLVQGFGYQVRVANTTAAALQLARTTPFTAVVCDIGLPDGSGLDLLRQLQALRPVKAIALSGYGMEEDIRKSLEAGFSAHLTKPVDMAVLEKALAEICG